MTVCEERHERRGDAGAICEAVARPVDALPIKNIAQQSVLALHRVLRPSSKARRAAWHSPHAERALDQIEEGRSSCLAVDLRSDYSVQPC